MAMTDEEWNVRAGAAALATCLVKTIGESDSTFQERFLKNLEQAYYHFRDDSAAAGSDGKPRPVTGALEILNWTREMLTGWNPITGQGNPLLK
ncbi:hypothetical protein [Bradyrhizobium sp. CCBAU 65884]|uniref:hypothetical protein n=1 Tax=Bradyrhizobium sp. CCBAU 65884 TaxID=722477 RepID=UPI0023053B89|nr:hypothetical protein [Bradyrhizobium sp. CCBAU 65884]